MFVNNQGEQNSLEVKGSLPVLLETLSQFSKALFTMGQPFDHVSKYGCGAKLIAVTSW